ncbi:nitrous oxide-stimulated promoter family protein [Paludibacter sp. 221]|uniref:nitrous oxide-stimulated promoter family protein n=1 Tax=Paludibacter sp. 221 TaxID=2302939 RepID=UPI0013CFF9A4|nr:nitrous oxide-stimulated promoter family protein [Paludibacter sp. 221]NDV46922.1 nitrous oxide-stimulated promoter family protein [Paludibacter sp. 221]
MKNEKHPVNEISYEKRTVERMIRLYCRKTHKSPVLCEECSTLLQYADDKLHKCPFGNEKPYCSRCHVHCYQPEMQERIRKVMRFSGPRMILYFPADFFRYCFSK